VLEHRDALMERRIGAGDFGRESRVNVAQRCDKFDFNAYNLPTIDVACCSVKSKIL
jgi:hypothetical protein